MGKSGRSVLCAVAVLAASASLLSTARGQFVQQGGKLVGTGTVGNSLQGFAVAVSADGSTAIVGGPIDNGFIGAAWVYTRSGGVWTQQGGKLVGTGATGESWQGSSVALSADGNTAMVGGYADGGEAGAAWVYTRSGSVWKQQGDKLVGTLAAGPAEQGMSVALSADGNTAIVGGLTDNTFIGAAWIFTRSGGVWSQQGAKLVGTGVSGSVTFQGDAVGLSADGNTAIVGGSGAEGGFGGAAWVYTRSNGAWSQQGGKLAGMGAVGLASQGGSVALSGDGNTAIVGGASDNAFAGAAWVFTRLGGVWSQQGPKITGTGAVGGANQGICVTLSVDGNTAVVGGDWDNGNVGAVWVHQRSGGVWNQQDAKLVGSGSAGRSLQGRSVALSADGSTVIAGGQGDNNQAGAAWVFVAATGPAISSAGVVNGASFLPGIAPGTWITIMGTNLSATTRSWADSDFSGNNLPTQLDGVGVAVNGKSAYVSYVSPTQLNALAPDDTAPGDSIAVQVTTPQGKTNVVNAVESALDPGLFTFGQDGGRYVAAVRADGVYIGSPNLIPGVTTVPAQPGDTILLFGTGFGPTTPANTIGQLVNPAPLANPVTVNVGGVAASTQFAGITGPGLYQFNVIVPNVPNGDNPVTVEIGGGSSQANVFLFVQR
ncbi:MAG TPA: hypothetical protein VN841_27380 [Bryobacteraceae bacterium]|nr:hypothetical protein [Bryobacteraceae bacterium]